MESITKENSFIKGTVRYLDLGYVVCTKDRLVTDKVPHSIFVAWDRGQFGDIETKSWNTAGICVVKDQDEHMLAVSEQGDVIVFGSGEHYEETIAFPENGPQEKGLLRGVRSIDNIAYVVGMNRQIYKRERKGVWRPIGEGIPPVKEASTEGFEAIDGYSKNELYAVGWKGNIAAFDGNKWTQNQALTNRIFADVCCADDGFVYVCGQVGTLLKGRGNKWQALDLGEFSQDIWSVAWFKDTLYFATMKNVFSLDNNQVVLVDMGNDHAHSAFQLSVRDNRMWSIGAKDLMSFDGENWCRIG